jgi:hypothetical protein
MDLLKQFRGAVQDAPKEDLKIAMKRRMRHQDIILRRFEERKQVTTAWLRTKSANHTARLSNLRKEGHVILRGEHLGGGNYEYDYLGKKEDE